MGEARAAACPRRCGGELGAGGICTTLLDIPHSSRRLKASIYQCSGFKSSARCRTVQHLPLDHPIIHAIALVPRRRVHARVPTPGFLNLARTS